VELTVTDNNGGATVLAKPVTVAAPAGAPFALDDFARPAGTLGTAQTGGNWTQNLGVSNIALDNGTAKFTTTTPGQTLQATLNGAPSTSTDQTFSFSTAATPVGARVYVSAIGRIVGTDDYRARWLIGTNGAVQAQLSRGGTVIVWQDLPGFTITPGTKYNVRLQVFGTGTTTIRSKIWAQGAQEPAAWQLSTPDTTPALQAAGHTGIATYAASAVSNLPFSVFFDDYRAAGVTP
jgi:hypothetical protein